MTIFFFLFIFHFSFSWIFSGSLLVLYSSFSFSLLHFTFTFHDRLCLFNTFFFFTSFDPFFLILYSFFTFSSSSSFLSSYLISFLDISLWIFYLRSREHIRHENQRPVVSLGRVQTDRQTDDDLMRDEQTQGCNLLHIMLMKQTTVVLNSAYSFELLIFLHCECSSQGKGRLL